MMMIPMMILSSTEKMSVEDILKKMRLGNELIQDAMVQLMELSAQSLNTQ